MQKIHKLIQTKLKENIDPKTLATGQHFFKEKIQLYGVKIPVVNKISKEIFSMIQDQPKKEVRKLCTLLWQSWITEETYIACNISYYLKDQYENSDFYIFEKWLDRYVNNRASCDTLCNHTIGTIVEICPEYISNLKERTKSKNRRVRRGAAVTLIIPARKGLFLKEIVEISENLLSDADDLVQKWYGRMLKAASEAHQQEIYTYLISKKTTMPRTAYRYALEKMPKELRQEAMKK